MGCGSSSLIVPNALHRTMSQYKRTVTPSDLAAFRMKKATESEDARLNDPAEVKRRLSEKRRHQQLDERHARDEGLENDLRVTSLLKDGEWNCAGCHHRNMERSTCLRCGSPNVHGEEQALPPPAIAAVTVQKIFRSHSSRKAQQAGRQQALATAHSSSSNHSNGSPRRSPRRSPRLHSKERDRVRHKRVPQPGARVLGHSKSAPVDSKRGARGGEREE